MANELVTSKTPPNKPGPRGSGDDPTAPSLVREDDPFFARLIGILGGALVIFGGIVLAMLSRGTAMRIGQGWATFWLAIGLAGLLFHAAYDRDIQFRRVYFAFGLGLLALGVFLALVPMDRVGDKFPLGSVCLALALFFMLAFLRHEDDQWLRNLTQYIMLGVGGLMATVGFVGNNVNVERFLPTAGAILPLLGLAYLSGFVATQDLGEDLAYKTGLGIGIVGIVVFLVALGRSVIPPLWHGLGWSDSGGGDYHVKVGVLMCAYGLLYAFVSALLCSDRPTLVLARRELGAYFYSPVAYIVLFAMTVGHWAGYFSVLRDLGEPKAPPMPEPIVARFIISLPGIFVLIGGIPALTMRLISEEKRVGTLEILFTSPLTETSLVVGKYLAAFFMFLTLWVPFGLMILAFRMIGGQPFDHYPLVAYFLILSVTGASFIAIGTFFSSVTRNQILSFVLTFTVLLVMTVASIYTLVTPPPTEPTVVSTLLAHTSYLDLWHEAVQGKVVLQLLAFPVSITVFFLFLTVKVLEARKWM